MIPLSEDYFTRGQNFCTLVRNILEKRKVHLHNLVFSVLEGRDAPAKGSAPPSTRLGKNFTEFAAALARIKDYKILHSVASFYANYCARMSTVLQKQGWPQFTPILTPPRFRKIAVYEFKQFVCWRRSRILAGILLFLGSKSGVARYICQN